MPSVRATINRQIFRGMLVSVAATVVAMGRVGVPRERIWSFSKIMSRNLCRMVGVRVTIRGADLVAHGGPFIFTPNHQSHFDIAALLAHLPGHARFASKKELFEDPILGQVMRTMGMIPIDRDDPMQSIDVLNRAVEKGHSLVIFPEGTRSRDGSLLPFKKGAFVAAIHMKRPIVPVIVKGSRERMPKGGYLAIEPGPMEIVLKPPIPTEGLEYDDRDSLRTAVRAIIEEEFEKPISED